MLEARIVGPAAELGDISDGLNFFGAVLTREWSPVDLSPEAQAKAKGNRYVELREGKAVKTTVPPEAEAETVKARLTELGVQFKSDASLKTLKSQLDKAEEAQAKAEQEAADAQAEADRLAAEAAAAQA